jgi:hypothetical protein
VGGREREPAEAASRAAYLQRQGLESDINAPADETSDLVGRQRELVALLGGLDDALSGRGRLFLLSGEPGIGKSRLADEVIARARERGARVLVGRCWEAGGAPAYWPWVQSLREYVREAEPNALRAELGPGAGDVAQIVPELRELFPDLRVPPTPETEDARFRLFDSTAAFLTRAADACPVVLELDDLHAADEPSLLLLRFVARGIANSRIFIVGAYRDVDPTVQDSLASTLAELARDAVTRRLSLSGLARADVARYIALNTGLVPAEPLVAQIHAETEGNPLFVGEVVRLLDSEGRLSDVSEPGTLGIPEGVREVIGQRLGRLSEGCTEVLTLAAVLGREFALDAFDLLCGRPRGEVLELLDEAIAARLVAEVPGMPGRLRFSHVLIRETLYDGLTATRRFQLHTRAGAALESLYANDPEPHLAELAHHFCAAAATGGKEKASQYARLAADRAVSLFAYEEAVRLYEMALAVTEAGQLERCELLLALAEAQGRAGNTPASKRTYGEAGELARALGLPKLFARAALGYGGRITWKVSRDDEKLVPFLEEALAALGNEDGALRVRLLARLGGGPLRDLSFPPERKAALTGEALERARKLGDPATLTYALAGYIYARHSPEFTRDQVELAAELIQTALEVDDLERAIEGFETRGYAFLELGDMEAAKADLSAMAKLAQRLRQPSHNWYVTALRAQYALLDGRLAEAEGLIADAVTLGDRAEAWSATVSSRLQLFLLRRLQGRLQEVEDLVRSSAADHPTYPICRCVLAYTLAALGKETESRETLEALVDDDSANLPFDEEWLVSMGFLAETATLVHDEQRAAVLYEHLLPYADRVAVSYPEISTGSVSRCLGILAAMLDRSDAERHFEAALQMNAKIGARPWLVYTQQDYERMLRTRDRPGDRERAGRLVASAGKTARDLGMNSLQLTPALLGESPLPGRRMDEPKAGEAIFRREGEYWSIVYEGEAFRLHDLKGLRYLARLLAEPGREIHALDLAAGESGRATGSRVAEPELRLSGFGDAGEILDAKAKKAYRERLAELEEEVDEARGFADFERAARAEEERQFLVHELAQAVGLGGRDRRSASAAERARLSVTRAIKSALERIREQSPTVGAHLDRTIRTGTFCSYSPDPRALVDWRL